MRFPGREIAVFGRPVVLPSMELNLHCVRLQIQSSRDVAADMEFEIQTELGPDFLCEYKFVQSVDSSSNGAATN
jgi:hypothetical protein